jgi:hypothetical protein
MLTEKQWDIFNARCNGEYLTQVDDAGFEAALDGVELALAVVNGFNELNLALAYLTKFADIRNVSINARLKRVLYVNNYGEEEVQAMEREGVVRFE